MKHEPVDNVWLTTAVLTVALLAGVFAVAFFLGQLVMDTIFANF